MHSGSPEAEESDAYWPELAAEKLACMNYNFHPDGTVEILMDDKIKKNGTWSLNDSGTKLSLNISGSEPEDWTINELRSDVFAVIKKNKTRTIFIPK